MDFEYKDYCPDQYLYAKLDNAADDRSYSFTRNCFCERMTLDELAFGVQMKYRNVCWLYVSNITTYYLILPAFGIFVAISNWLIRKMVEYCTLWMRFSDMTTEGKFMVGMAYVLQFLFMAIP